MVQRVLELLWWRERDWLEQRVDSREAARKRHRPEPGAEKQRQRERDRSMVDGGQWNRVARERVCRQRERECRERDEKVKSSVLFIFLLLLFLNFNALIKISGF
jgi:hypothetical protein